MVLRVLQGQTYPGTATKTPMSRALTRKVRRSSVLCTILQKTARARRVSFTEASPATHVMRSPYAAPDGIALTVLIMIFVPRAKQQILTIRLTSSIRCEYQHHASL